jgi:protein gp37
MATSIEWSQNPDGTPGESWNPTRGCLETSPGCARCYAKTFAERWRGVKDHPYEQGFDPRTVPSKLADPLKWKKSKTVFVNSMSDLWLETFSNEYIAAVFGVMAACPQHTFIALTKRAERLPKWFEWASSGALDRCAVYADDHLSHLPPSELVLRFAPGRGSRTWPLPNVRLGVSVENRKHGVPRIALLRQVPAACRVLSIEPLLEDLGDLDLKGIHWVLVGGESGQGARRFDLAWARKVVAQCIEQKVPVFVKQMGANPRDQLGLVKLRDRKGGDPSEWPEDLRVRQFPEVR